MQDPAILPHRFYPQHVGLSNSILMIYLKNVGLKIALLRYTQRRNTQQNHTLDIIKDCRTQRYHSKNIGTGNSTLKYTQRAQDLAAELSEYIQTYSSALLPSGYTQGMKYLAMSQIGCIHRMQDQQYCPKEIQRMYHLAISEYRTQDIYPLKKSAHKPVFINQEVQAIQVFMK